MAASFMPFHVASYTERFSAAGVWTLERFLSRVRMTMYA